MKLNEQIAFYRRRMGMTQEKLAAALGVTNQAVSKWESGANCPDISLLPRLADLFCVSVDQLLGRECASDAASEDILRTARGLHAKLLTERLVKLPDQVPFFDPNRMRSSAERGEWGYTAWYEPGITTVMRRDTVLFSGNRCENWSDGALKRVANTLRPFSDVRNLKIAYALFRLTEEDEERRVSPAEVAKECGLPEEAVTERLEDALAAYLEERDGLFRLDGMYMDVIPILSLLDYR